jgi:hypothetical protein
MIPYPGRDLAILAIIIAFVIPLLGPVIGFFTARAGIEEARTRGYGQIGIHRFAYGFGAILLLIQLLCVLLLVLNATGFFSSLLS